MWKKIRNLILKCLIALFPIYVIFGAYVYLDPFRVVHPSDPFFDMEDPMHVGWNKGFVSTEAFKNHHQTEHYDSYIFGSSLSIGYQAEEWSKYVGKSARIFHFDGSTESFTGIIKKIRYINKCGETVKNALIVADPTIFARDDDKESHLFAQHPDITPQWDFIQFQWLFFKLFMNREFLTNYIDMRTNGLTPKMVAIGIFTKEIPDYDVKTNEEKYPFYEKELAENEEQYYAKRDSFFGRNYSESIVIPPMFTEKNIENFKTLKGLFEKNSTNYKIIIHPMYKLNTLCEKDRNILYDIFGKENLYDFSGANEFSLDKHNYYDQNSHPRPGLCNKLMKIVYGQYSTDSINSLKSR